jgi:hypothetical protein
LEIPDMTHGFMPLRGDQSAPTFHGDEHDLPRFFDEIDMLGSDCGLTDAMKIHYTLQYLNNNDYELWSSLPAASAKEFIASAKDFIAFRRAVFGFYPGATDSIRYTTSDLEQLVK